MCTGDVYYDFTFQELYINVLPYTQKFRVIQPCIYYSGVLLDVNESDNNLRHEFLLQSSKMSRLLDRVFLVSSASRNSFIVKMRGPRPTVVSSLTLRGEVTGCGVNNHIPRNVRKKPDVSTEINSHSEVRRRPINHLVYFYKNFRCLPLLLRLLPYFLQRQQER